MGQKQFLVIREGEKLKKALNFLSSRFLPKAMIGEIRVKFDKEFPKMVDELFKEAVFSEKYSTKFKPLSERWLAYKESHSFIEQPWMATGWLIDSFHVAPLQGKDGGIMIGFKDIEHVNSKLGVIDLAYILEHGTLDGAIPERPILKFFLEDIKKPTKELLDKLTKEALNKLEKKAKRMLK